MKSLRHNAIRELVAHALVANQDELRRKLRRRGFAVTQATLSRDIHELRLSKGPGGYTLSNGSGHGRSKTTARPLSTEMMEGFGLRVRQAMNQVVLATMAGGAQPLAAALDHEGWTDVVGTVAGDDTVLVICPDHRRASEVEARLRRCWNHDQDHANSGSGSYRVRGRGTGQAAVAASPPQGQAAGLCRARRRKGCGAGRRSSGRDSSRNWPIASGSGASPAGTIFLGAAGWPWRSRFCFSPRRTSNRGSGCPKRFERGMRVIDLSGAWRLNEAANRAVYAFEDDDSELAAATQAQAVYGMPELHRAQIAGARLIANPGCYATSIILPLRPLVAAGLVDLTRGIVADAKSGVSGAGKAPTAKTHFMYAADNLSAYGVFTHRHTGELLEQIGLDASEIIFTPHLLPIPRGILSTIYVHFREPQTRDSIAKRLPRILSPAAPWSGSTTKRCRRFSTRSAPTMRISAFNSPPTAAARSLSVAWITC